MLSVDVLLTYQLDDRLCSTVLFSVLLLGLSDKECVVCLCILRERFGKFQLLQEEFNRRKKSSAVAIEDFGLGVGRGYYRIILY